MGINARMLNFIADYLHLHGIDLEDARMCLLGNQYLATGTKKVVAEWGTKVVQEFYAKQGAKVVSIDLNGKDGALKLDLTKEIPVSLLAKHNVVINAGTTEHIEDQYAVFKSINDLCDIDGLIFHMVPASGHWPRHGFYGYTQSFFLNLAKLCNYELLALEQSDYISLHNGAKQDLVLACFKNLRTSWFLLPEAFEDLTVTLQRRK